MEEQIDGMEYLNINCIYQENGIYCKNTCLFKDIFCDTHKNADINKYSALEREYCVNNVKLLLSKLSTIYNKLEKLDISHQIFDILINHKHFIYTHIKFLKTVYNKLEELKDEPMFNYNKYKQEIFPENNSNEINCNEINCDEIIEIEI